MFIAASGRPVMFHNMLASLRATTQGHDVEVIAVIDNDPQSADVATAYGVDVLDYSTKRRGALKAWNIGLFLSDGDLLVPAGDDQLFHEGWLEHALVAHQRLPDESGVVGLNDLAYKPPQTATMFLFDRAYCREVMGGIFAPPMLHYYCVDSWWNEKAKMLGKFYWESKSVVEHLHAAHGKRPMDATDGFKEDKWMEIDNQTFEERKAQGFPVTWSPII